MTMTKLDKDWQHNFEYAMTGNAKCLQEIVKEDVKFKVVLKQIQDEQYGKRYDVMGKGYKMNGFIAGVDYEVEETIDKAIQMSGIISKPTKEWPMGRGRYGASDYQVNQNSSIEDILIAAIDAAKHTKPRLQEVQALNMGSRVQILIDGHYYDKSEGRVTATRPNGQYLVEISSRTAPKRNYLGSTGCAQMWVSANDVKVM